MLREQVSDTPEIFISITIYVPVKSACGNGSSFVTDINRTDLSYSKTKSPCAETHPKIMTIRHENLAISVRSKITSFIYDDEVESEGPRLTV